jgi:LemA protein
MGFAPAGDSDCPMFMKTGIRKAVGGTEGKYVTTFWIILAVVIGGLYLWYASLISRRNRAFEALSGIDVQLKKRADLIPNILTIAQKFMDHEKELLTEVTALRAKVGADYDARDPGAVADHFGIAEALSSRMGQIMVAVEAYPELKSDETMIEAQRSYNEVEAQISAARRFYNSAVSSLNNAVQIFPGSMIAQFANVVAMPFYEADEAARQPVNAGDYLK